jgi:carbamoylphosphate synthase small subunit
MPILTQTQASHTTTPSTNLPIILTVFSYRMVRLNNLFKLSYPNFSKGPGDPTHCQDTVYNLKRLMETSQIPIMGICMGHQLLALASGARTVKLKYGNRAHNIPALDLTTGKCHITSQNHGYAVDAETLGDEWKEYFINLNEYGSPLYMNTNTS